MLARWRGMAVYTDRHLDEPPPRASLEGKVACLAPGERTVAILEHLLDGETARLAAARAAGRRRGRRGLVGRRANARFRRDLAAVVDDEIRPAFIRLHDALVTEILPNARLGGPARACATSPRVPTATAG